MLSLNSIKQGPKDLYQKIDNNPGKVAIAAGTLGVAAAITAGLIATVATPALAVLGGLAIFLAIYQAAKAYNLRNQVEALPTSKEDLSKALIEYNSDPLGIEELKKQAQKKQNLAGKQLNQAEKEVLNSYEFELPKESFNWKKAAKTAALVTAIAGTGYAAYAYGPTAIANLAPVKNAAMAKLAVAAETASNAVVAASRYASTFIARA